MLYSTVLSSAVLCLDDLHEFHMFPSSGLCGYSLYAYFTLQSCGLWMLLEFIHMCYNLIMLLITEPPVHDDVAGGGVCVPSRLGRAVGRKTSICGSSVWYGVRHCISPGRDSSSFVTWSGDLDSRWEGNCWSCMGEWTKASWACLLYQQTELCFPCYRRWSI